MFFYKLNGLSSKSKTIHGILKMLDVAKSQYFSYKRYRQKIFYRKLEKLVMFFNMTKKFAYLEYRIFRFSKLYVMQKISD